jgi:hypothetical protein
MEVSGQFHAPAASNPKKQASVPIGQESWWTSEPVWTPVAIPTELSRSDDNNECRSFAKRARTHATKLAHRLQLSGFCGRGELTGIYGDSCRPAQR